MEVQRRAIGLDTNAGQQNFILTIFFSCLATITVIGRFTARFIKRSRLGADDWLMLLGLVSIIDVYNEPGEANALPWIFYYCQVVVNILSIAPLLLNVNHLTLTVIFFGGVGSHIDTLQAFNLEHLFQLITAVQFPYALAMTAIRCSICMLLIQIFSVRSFRYAIYGVIAFNIIWCLFIIIAAVAVCQPFQFNWDKTIPGGHCGDQDSLYVAIAALAIISDSFILAIPVPMIWNLQLKTSNKMSLTLVFALGIVDIAVSVLRIVTIVNINFEGDISYTATESNIWSISEPAIAILVGCGPVMRPLLDRMMRSGPATWTKVFRLSRCFKADESNEHMQNDQAGLV